MASEAWDTPAQAAGLLHEVDRVRARLARRLTTPWWYKTLSGVIVGLLFVGVGMAFDNFPFGDAATGSMLVVCIAAQALLQVDWALVAGAGVGFLVTYALECRTDAALDRGELPPRSGNPAW